MKVRYRMTKLTNPHWRPTAHYASGLVISILKKGIAHELLFSDLWAVEYAYIDWLIKQILHESHTTSPPFIPCVYVYVFILPYAPISARLIISHVFVRRLVSYVTASTQAEPVRKGCSFVRRIKGENFSRVTGVPIERVLIGTQRRYSAESKIWKI